MGKTIRRIIIKARIFTETKLSYAQDGKIGLIKKNEIDVREINFFNEEKKELKRIILNKTKAHKGAFLIKDFLNYITCKVEDDR